MCKNAISCQICKFYVKITVKFPGEIYKFFKMRAKLNLYVKFSGGGGREPLVFEVGYHPRKKIHVIKVVFQNQAMYTRTSFRGTKTCKI